MPSAARYQHDVSIVHFENFIVKGIELAKSSLRQGNINSFLRSKLIIWRMLKINGRQNARLVKFTAISSAWPNLIMALKQKKTNPSSTVGGAATRERRRRPPPHHVHIKRKPFITCGVRLIYKIVAAMAPPGVSTYRHYRASEISATLATC